MDTKNEHAARPPKSRYCHCGRMYGKAPAAADCPDPDWHYIQRTAADDLVDAVEREIHSRKGIGWEHLDDDIQDEIRDALVAIVRPWVKGKE